MRHLLISREYPPAPAGGIGTYTAHIARLLVEAGEIVHVIGQRWAGADIERDVLMDGRLVVHRVPYDDWNALLGARPHPDMQSSISRQLFRSSVPAQAFAWETALVAERIIEQESIDVIEAQEYESPAYFLALRRALGLGPKKMPPLIVHMHSPTEFIARHNEWDRAAPMTLTATRLERTTLEMADGLLCPSAYLARNAEAHFGFEPGAVKVIPLPFGREPELRRRPEAWRSGPIVYVGRLERRKGVLEWIEAAVATAATRPDVTFEFIGGNVLGTRRRSGESELDHRIPAALRRRFKFHGHGNRQQVRELLGRARMAVVPSRWENFPYTCVEAMASGLPVLASPEGGMAEMIEDGQSGWIAGGATPEALRAALDRALEESPERLAAMGSAAAAAIRQLCDPDRVVRMHLEFRQEVCERGARQAAGRTRPPAPGQGVACIVIDGTDEAAVERTVRSLGAQSVSPAAVVIVRMKEPGTDAAPGMPFDARLRATWRYHDVMEGHKGVARNAAAAFAIELVREAVGVPPLGLAFVEPGVELDPCFLDVAVRALHAEAHAGLVAGWTLTRTGTLSAPPQPSFPHQFLGNDVGPGAVIRVQAFSDVAGFDGAVPEGVESWDLANRIMANGWRAVTIPALAAVDRANRPVPDLNGLSPQHALLERLPDVVSRHAHELAVLAAAAIARSSTDAPPWAPPTLRDVIGFVVRHPLQTARRLNERTRMLMRMRAAERRARSSRGSAR